MEKKEKEDKKKFSFRHLTMDKIVLIIAAGAVLLLFSFPGEKKEEDSNPTISAESGTFDENESYEEKLEERLARILESMDGVGKTEVMITLKASEEKILDKNTDYQKSQVTEEDAQGGKRISDEESRKEDTVLSGNGGDEEGPYTGKKASGGRNRCFSGWCRFPTDCFGNK